MSEEQRGFVDDLWKQAFSIRTSVDAFKEGRLLHGEEKVFVFGGAQPILLRVDGQRKETYVPTLVVIVSPFPPSHKIGVIFRQADSEEIIDMENVNMGWVPYIPLEEHERASSLERPLPQIYIISCLQREAASNFFELYPNFRYCLPYVDNPYNEVDESGQNTVVDIVYPAEAGTIDSKFQWKFDSPEEFANRLIDAGKLSRAEKDAFKGLVIEKVKEGKRANHEAIGQIFDLEESRRIEERIATFEKMRFYKFYPVATPDTPNLARARVKSPYINRYYGRAHQVF